MTHKICYWDSDAMEQRERDSTPDEDAQRAADIAAAAAASIPQSIPMLNARLVLIAQGLMPAVVSYMDGLPGTDGEKARAFFEYALTMRRDHELVTGFQAALDMTDAQIDSLFVAAAALSV